MKRGLAIALIMLTTLADAQRAETSKKSMTPEQAQAFIDAVEQIANEPRPPLPPKRELGMIDNWRYESCLTDAAKNPTAAGVRLGVRLCNEKFGQ